jgi:hypothetical protein
MEAAAEAGSGLSSTAAVGFALLSTLILAALHLLAPHIRRLPIVPEYATASFAGGLAVAYVFLHLLPELAEGNAELAEVLGDQGQRTPLLGLEIFLVALLGFLIFYGLERLAERSRDRLPTGRGDDGGGPGDQLVPKRGSGSDGVFQVHLASFMIYNGIIAYTLPLDWRTSIPFAVLFTVAIGLHFVLTDRGLEEHYGWRFDRWPPRLLLAGALVLGWLIAALFAPTSGLVVSLLTAFLAGGILLNVFKEEIPSTRSSHFGWFTLGLALYALLLGLVTAAQDEALGAEGDAVSHPGVELLLWCACDARASPPTPTLFDVAASAMVIWPPEAVPGGPRLGAQEVEGTVGAGQGRVRDDEFPPAAPS